MSEQNRGAVPSDIAEYQKFVADGGKDASAADKTKPSDAADAAETNSDSETETQTQERKKKSGFQRRVTRLNREIGERDARIAALEREVAERGGKPATQQADADKPAVKPEAKTPEKPKLDDFKTYDEYVEALAEYKTEIALAKREQERAEQASQQAEQTKGQAVIEAHKARVDEAMTRYDDWATAFDGLNDQSFTDAMAVTIFESDRGPDISYFLATNRDELARIAKLSPVRQAAELGKIEARFAADDAGDDDDEPKTKPESKPKPRVTQAPPAAKPLKGKATPEDAMPDPRDFAKYEAWAKRKAANAHRN